MPNHHEILIRLSKDSHVVTDPSPALHVGDTVCYASPDGKARVYFPSGSPFAVSQVSDGQPQTVKTLGHFEFQCYITPTGKTEEVGWDPKNPKAGGVHDVIPGL
jgi:hypothetical protein